MPNPQLIDSHIEQVSAYLLSLRDATSGPQPRECAAEIARVQKDLDQARARRAAARSGPQSTSAGLHRQPTPSSIARAEVEAQQALETSLAEAQRLEADDKDSECIALIKKISLPANVGLARPSDYTPSKRTAAAGASDVRRLLRLMDKDRNGNVSRDEFMQFVSQTFDRLDVNKSGGLESGEASNTSFPFGTRVGAAADADVQKLLHQMDTDKNGTVTKDEFLQFMSQTFDRLDANKSGRLEREELRRLSNTNLICHDLGIC